MKTPRRGRKDTIFIRASGRESRVERSSLDQGEAASNFAGILVFSRHNTHRGEDFLESNFALFLNDYLLQRNWITFLRYHRCSSAGVPSTMNLVLPQNIGDVEAVKSHPSIQV